jgi:nickel-dependent lactate racemase
VKTIRIPYGQHELKLNLPAANLVGVYSPQDYPAVADLKSEILRAVASPIGTKPVRELAKGADKVVLIADDNTRLTPTDKIIPVLLDELNAAGVRDRQISIIIALGTHRFMTEAEILAKFGDEVVRRVTIKNHDYKDPAAMVDLGTTSNGTSILVNREAYEADFKIGIGSIVQIGRASCRERV